MSSYGAIATRSDENPQSLPFTKQEKCNDVLFALLFLGHFSVVIAILITNRAKATPDDDEDIKFIWKFLVFVTLAAFGLSGLALGVISALAKVLVQVALCFSLFVLGSLTVYSIFYTESLWMAVLNGTLLLLMCLYMCFVQRRIPFAASNLRTALSAIQSNFSMVIMSYALQAVAFGYIWLWASSSILFLKSADSFGSMIAILFCYLVSLFWTQQVITNIQHTIVASMIGTWWYAPTDANSCWDDGLNQTIWHSLTYNFGSICMGSLLVALVQGLKYLLRSLRQSFDCCDCILDCCLTCIEDMVQYFNSWAYTYIGIHGDSYFTSGRKVMTLFDQVGWDGIINDELASVVLWFLKITIALLTGFMGRWYVSTTDGYDIPESSDGSTVVFTKVLGASHNGDDADTVAFIASTMVGYFISSIMMELVHSAVHGVIVCLAESPALFHYHHPELADELLTAWKDCYPEECADEFLTTPSQNYAVVTC